MVANIDASVRTLFCVWWADRLGWVWWLARILFSWSAKMSVFRKGWNPGLSRASWGYHGFLYSRCEVPMRHAQSVVMPAPNAIRTKTNCSVSIDRMYANWKYLIATESRVALVIPFARNSSCTYHGYPKPISSPCGAIFSWWKSTQPMANPLASSEKYVRN